MYGLFDNDHNDNSFGFWGTNSDNGWGFGGKKEDREIQDLWGQGEREGKSFWDVLGDLFFR